MGKVIIWMGSKKDKDHISGIRELFNNFNVEYEVRALSGHKMSEKVLESLEKYEKEYDDLIFIVVAGRSNAIGPMISGNSHFPVINCPVISSYKEDIYSSLRMPSNVPCSTILEPKNAALHAIEILSMKDEELKQNLKNYFEEERKKLEESDKEVSSL